MNLFNEQSFLQILPSTSLPDSESVQKELSVPTDLQEEHNVESQSELRSKLQLPKDERALLIQETTQTNQDFNDSFTEIDIQEILKIMKGIKNVYQTKESKEFIQTLETDLTADIIDALIQKLEACLRDVKTLVQSVPKRTPKQVKSFDFENNPYKDKINDLISGFKENPNDELRLITIQKILEVVEAVKKDYNFTQQKNFVQTNFDSKLTGKTEEALLAKTVAFLESNILTIPNVSSQEGQEKEISPTLNENTLLRDNVATVIENYVHQAVQLRDEKSYELTDENILKIVELAKEIKKAYKIEGLKSFMSSLGINAIGVKNGELIDKIANYFEDVALMRFKAVRMQEMK